MLRRNFLKASGAGVLLPLLGCSKRDVVGNDISQLEATALERIAVPGRESDLQETLSIGRSPLCFRGAGYSQGGHTLATNSVQIDMSGLTGLVFLDVERKVVRVQAGMSWHDLQKKLDPHGLSVKVMQSFSNFTVGGAVSVNCHGRYVGHGSISSTVRALRVLLSSGQALELSRTTNAELFSGVIGGYGLLCLIIEVELDLADNVIMERHVESMTLAEYPSWFDHHVKNNPGAVMHNADLLPPSFDRPMAITWVETAKPLTDGRRLQDHQEHYGKEQSLVWAATELPGRNTWRESYTQRQLAEPRVIHRNLEASLDVRRLEPQTRLMSTYLLQEYFIPVERFASFTGALSRILASANVEIMNVSIRHALPDGVSILRWAREEVFCFVLYYKQRRYANERDVRVWTQALIDEALKNGGTYYLPYRPLATRDQVHRAYAEVQKFVDLKQDLDPHQRLQNHFWQRYLRPF